MTAFLAVHLIMSDIRSADPDGWALAAWAAIHGVVVEGLIAEELVSLALDGAQVCDSSDADAHLARILDGGQS